MKRTDWMKESIRAGQLFHIRNQRPITNNLLNIGAASLLWTCIATLLFLPIVTPWYIWPVISVLLGSCFFGHFVLIIHECSHNMFIHSKRASVARYCNTVIGSLLAIPFFTDYKRHWENGHVLHHLHPCENEDPQNPDPLDGKRLLKKVLFVWLIPVGFLTANPSSKYPDRPKRMFLGILCWLPIFFLLFQYHWQSLIVLNYAFSMLATLNLCKIAQEHGSGLAFEPDPLLRSRSYFYPFQLIFSPFNINYHYEHHANFNVPWYLLPKYHRALRNILPTDVQPYYFHREYIQQLLGKKSLPPRNLLGLQEEILPASK